MPTNKNNFTYREQVFSGYSNRSYEEDARLAEQLDRELNPNTMRDAEIARQLQEEEFRQSGQLSTINNRNNSVAGRSSQRSSIDRVVGDPNLSSALNAIQNDLQRHVVGAPSASLQARGQGSLDREMVNNYLGRKQNTREVGQEVQPGAYAVNQRATGAIPEWVRPSGRNRIRANQQALAHHIDHSSPSAQSFGQNPNRSGMLIGRNGRPIPMQQEYIAYTQSARRGASDDRSVDSPPRAIATSNQRTQNAREHSNGFTPSNVPRTYHNRNNGHQGRGGI